MVEPKSEGTAMDRARLAQGGGRRLTRKRDLEGLKQLYEEARDGNHDAFHLISLSAFYFEKGAYQKTIKTCLRAIDEGREDRADFKLIVRDGINVLNKSRASPSPAPRTPYTLAKLK
ncbi:hypothetical protein RQP46_005576 [Phenoliferia psychrophenolica]